LIELIEFFSPDFKETRGFLRTHQAPVLILLNALHKQIRDPKGIKQIPSSILLSTRVLLQIQKIKDIRMPRLQVNGKSTWTLWNKGLIIKSSCLARVSRTKQFNGIQLQTKIGSYLVASLIHVSSSVVVDTKHWDKSVGNPIRSSDVGSSGTDAVDVDPNPTSTF